MRATSLLCILYIVAVVIVLTLEGLQQRLSDSQVLHPIQNTANVQHGDHTHPDAAFDAELHIVVLVQVRGIEIFLNRPSALRRSQNSRVHIISIRP